MMFYNPGKRSTPRTIDDVLSRRYDETGDGSLGKCTLCDRVLSALALTDGVCTQIATCQGRRGIKIITAQERLIERIRELETHNATK